MESLDLLPSSPSPLTPLLDFIYDYSPILTLVGILALISTLPARHLKKLRFVAAAGLSTTLFATAFVYMAMFSPVALCLIIAVALFLVLCCPVIIIVASDEEARAVDIESGWEVPVISLTTTTLPELPVVRQPPRYITFCYGMDKKCAFLFSGDECVVCWEKFKQEDTCSYLRCAHVYHRECIERWLDVADQKLCPICCREV